MKSVFTFLCLMLTLLLMNGQRVNGQEYWNSYFVNENFDDVTTVPFTVRSGTTSVYGRSGSTSCSDGVLLFSGSSPSGNRGSSIVLRDDTIKPTQDIFIEFDITIDAATSGAKNAFLISLLGSNNINVNSGDGSAVSDIILGVYLNGSGNAFHYWNQDIQGPSPIETPDAIVPAFQTGQYPNFSRSGSSVAIADSLNAGTKMSVSYAAGSSYHFAVVLDFTNKLVKSLEITDKDNPANSQLVENMPFISSTASDLFLLDVINTRSSNSGNGAAVNYSASFDYLQIYEKVPSIGKDKVTVFYKDREDNEVKPKVEYEDQERGLEFKLPDADKKTFIEGNNYYAYDAVLTGTGSVIVEEGGSSITVYYKKSPLYSGDYTWTGAESAFWDELDNNFAIEGNNTVSYQQQNGVIFGESASKEITVLGNKNLGSGDLTINSAGYNLSGDGVLSGDGTLFVNASATIGVENKLAGGLVLTQGTLEIKNAAAATKYVVEAGTGLNVNAATLSAPIEGNGGALTIIPTYQAVTTSAITGVDVLNYELQHQGRHNRMNYSGMPRLNNSFAGQLNVTTALDSAYFGTTITYPDTKINLGDNVYLAYSDSPVKPDDVPEGTIVSIGELTGTEKSGISGALLRKLTYKIGGLNTDATFAGSLYRLPGDGWYNPVTLNITKEGTGEWALTGNSPEYAGELVVENGTLRVDGIIGSLDMMVPQPIENPDKPESDWTKSTTLNATVADGATLTGTGHIYGLNTIINGTLAGNLTFEGAVQLEVAAKTKIVINGNTSDKITVKGDFYVDGALEIEVKSAPTVGTYTIFDAPGALPIGDPEKGFTSITYPTGEWSFDIWTGVLTYNGGYSSIDTLDTNKEVVSKEYFDLVGKLVVAGSYEGLVIEKVRYTDGSVSLSKKLLKKN